MVQERRWLCLVAQITPWLCSKLRRTDNLICWSRILRKGSGGLSSTCQCESGMQGVLIGMNEDFLNMKEKLMLKKMVEAFYQ